MFTGLESLISFPQQTQKCPLPLPLIMIFAFRPHALIFPCLHLKVEEGSMMMGLDPLQQQCIDIRGV
jgi:hypothetical protein